MMAPARKEDGEPPDHPALASPMPLPKLNGKDMQGRHAISMNPRYHDGLAEFKKRCTDYASTMRALDDLLKAGAIGGHVGRMSQVRVADIGCGDGVVTEYFARELKAIFSGTMSLDIVEPLEHYVTQVKARLESLAGPDFNAIFVTEKAEKYFSRAEIAEAYDIVFSSHSLHLMPLGVLAGIVSSLKPGGFLVVVIGSKRSVMSLLKDLFVPRPAITGEDVLRFMAERFPGAEVTVKQLPSVLDLDGIVLPERMEGLTEVAKNLLSIMAQKNLDDVGEAGYTRAREIILERQRHGRLQLDNDLVVFRKSAHRAKVWVN